MVFGPIAQIVRVSERKLLLETSSGFLLRQCFRFIKPWKLTQRACAILLRMRTNQSVSLCAVVRIASRYTIKPFLCVSEIGAFEDVDLLDKAWLTSVSRINDWSQLFQQQFGTASVTLALLQCEIAFQHVRQVEATSQEQKRRHRSVQSGNVIDEFNRARHWIEIPEKVIVATRTSN
ncbi:hypothetical protein J6590_016655 [Homalodisca vitripennis]|nr:hypothetical protein J6590_016655 [Homalodisca vitripennis]